MTSGKLWPVSTCMSGNGKRAGPEGLLGQAQQHDRVLAAAEQQHGALELGGDLAHDVDGLGLEGLQVGQLRVGELHADVQPALDLVGPRPAALAAAAGLGAGRAADRGVALVVQRVVGQVALVDALPEVALGPVGERVVLPHRALVVELDELRVGARGGLLAADAGDPGVGALQRALERRDLGVAAAVRRARPRQAGIRGVLDLDVHAEALLEGAPRLQRLGEEHAGVDGHHARVRRQRRAARRG